MNRRQLKGLANDRIRDARVLIRNERYVGAYYLGGYAIECALKACIARQTRRHDFPNKKLAAECHTHDLARLVGLAGLKGELEKQLQKSKDFETNWNVVKDWSAEDRYTQSISPIEASDLYRAVSAKTNGVLTWLRKYW